jgi:ribosomal-protein-alanine N-acetyltransferase
MLRYWIEPLADDGDLEGVLEVEAESFTNPWTREMYSWELQNQSMCHILIVRTDDCRVAGFCAFRILLDEVHINNFALRPAFRAQGIGTALLQRVIADGRDRGARRATLEVRSSNEPARRLYERMGFYVAGVRRGYYTHPVEDALNLWRDDDVVAEGVGGAGVPIPHT